MLSIVMSVGFTVIAAVIFATGIFRGRIGLAYLSLLFLTYALLAAGLTGHVYVGIGEIICYLLFVLAVDRTKPRV